MLAVGTAVDLIWVFLAKVRVADTVGVVALVGELAGFAAVALGVAAVAVGAAWPPEGAVGCDEGRGLALGVD